MVRRVKGAVGICHECGSDAVYSLDGKYMDKKRHWSVVCSNPDCRKSTPGYDCQQAALADWNKSWGRKS